jgi:hypothetical protein
LLGQQPSNSYGSYPDIDELYSRQAAELDHKKREAILTRHRRFVASDHQHQRAAKTWGWRGCYSLPCTTTDLMVWDETTRTVVLRRIKKGARDESIGMATGLVSYQYEEWFRTR